MRRRALKFSVALLATLLTLEFGLQLAALFASENEGDRVAVVRGAAEPIRILCVGDSHTYGQGVERNEAYPAQLAAALGARHPETALEVWNLGVRGVNAAYVAKRLEGQILRFEPKLVIVWAGTNNMWNTLEAGEGGAEGPLAPLHRGLLNVKLYRLAVVLWHTRAGAFEPLDALEMADGMDAQSGARKEAYEAWLGQGVERSAAKVERSLDNDIRRIVSVAQANRVPVMFLTYPQARQDLPVSSIIERTANALGVPVVVTAADRARALADGLRDVQLFVFSAGPHPSPLMYRYIVESLVPRVEALLVRGGSLRVAPS